MSIDESRAAILGARDEHGFPPGIESLFENVEGKASARRAFDETTGAASYRTVGVIGGGTAGYFTALALRKHLPHLDVTLVESETIPIIGVGEATVSDMLPFLHHYLKLDIHAFYAAVKPTWKLGIHFEWGLPGDYAFEAPFDWGRNGVGILGSLQHRGDITAMSLESLLMSRDASPILRGDDGTLLSLLPHLPFGYHLDNQRLVAYLKGEAKKAGVKHVTADVADVTLAEDGETVTRLTTTDGQALVFDLFVDCSGFRSLLLGRAQKTPFISYASSLLTDTAVAFNHPHGGHIKPYTRARTMDHGWCWTIPQVEDDHSGYVFCSSFCNVDKAVEEIHRTFDGVGEHRVVKFRSGRHERGWRGNVIAIGNSYAFVEPLESTGLLMICNEIRSLVALFPRSKTERAGRELYNAHLGRSWDDLRWFLAIHYKFNRRRSTEFWNAVRNDADISGIQLAVDLFREYGPLTGQHDGARRMLVDVRVPFFGLAGFDCLMLGQQVVDRPYTSPEPKEPWGQRLAIAEDLARLAVPTAEALRMAHESGDLLDELVHDRESWLFEAGQFWPTPVES